MAQVSVIIPVYNTEKYLQKCLDSVCNQTLKDIEIICVNDCSPDNSLAVLQEYAKNDNRIKLINFTENKGAAAARNAGIDATTGEYIGFVDSDDFVDLDFYEKLYSKAKETDADAVKGNYKYSNRGVCNVFLNKKVEEHNKLFAFEFCSAVFRRDIIITNHIKFPDLCDMEDPVFTFHFALCAKEIAICWNANINITERSDSQTASIPSEGRLEAKIIGLHKLVELANKYSNIYGRILYYVVALWFHIVALNIALVVLERKLNLAKALLKVVEQISSKDSFFYYLRSFSEELYMAVKNNDIEKFLYFEKIDILKKQSIELKGMHLSQEVAEDYAKFLFSNYAIENIKKSTGEKIYFVSVVNNYALYDQLIRNNVFVKLPQNIECVDYNNVVENIPIPIRYNSFLNNYDYKQDAWFVFCHCDWELWEDINPVLNKLDKNYIYGPIGAKLEYCKEQAYSTLSGFCYEKRRDGTGLRILGDLKNVPELTDTFDCQALIVHSSLVKKFNLRFDENLYWDLYVEDFSINAKLKYNIASYALHFRACHWSGYHSIPASYYATLDYINKKYPDHSFAGTVSIIGGLDIFKANFKDIILHRLRKNIIKSSKK